MNHFLQNGSRCGEELVCIVGVLQAVGQISLAGALQTDHDGFTLLQLASGDGDSLRHLQRDIEASIETLVRTPVVPSQ